MKTAANPAGGAVLDWLQRQFAGAAKGVGALGKSVGSAQQALKRVNKAGKPIGTAGGGMDAFLTGMKGNWGNVGRAAVPTAGALYLGGKAVGGVFD